MIVAVIALALSAWYILASFEWYGIASLLRQTNFSFLIAGGTATLLAYTGIRAWRWAYLLRRAGIKIGFAQIYLCSTIGIAFSHITPFQLGEMAKIELVKRHATLTRLTGYGSFAVERFADLLIASALALISVIAMHQNLGLNIYWISGMLFGVLLSAIGFIGSTYIQRMAWVVAGRRELSMFLNNSDSVLVTGALTLAGWLVIAMGWQICLLAVGIDLGFLRSVALTSIVTIINILSFLPGGIGVSEAGISEFLLRLGFPHEAAQAGAITIRGYGLLMLVVGLVHLPLWYRQVRPAVAGNTSDTSQ